MLLSEEIEPYDITLNNMDSTARRYWASKVIMQLRRHFDLENDHFILLAGQKYREYLIPHLNSYEISLAGLMIGKQLQYLKGKVINERDM